MTWPSGVNPRDLPNFETQARRLRFQELGKACRDEGIRSLLLAHHNDDQAETVLLRLASGHKGFGLRGIDGHTQIPECWGIHGVHMSGQYEIGTLGSKPSQVPDDAPSSYYQRTRAMRPISQTFEQGGVHVFRPLLTSSKEQLIETCRSRGVVWAEDHTNKDITKTPRNVIRSLLRSTKLPKALYKNALLTLATEWRYKKRIHDYQATRLFELCQMLNFDARSGRLDVRFPNYTCISQHVIDGISGRSIASMLVRKLLDIVTPREEILLRALENAIDSIFPALKRPKISNIEMKPDFTSFTACDVQFQRILHGSSESTQAKKVEQSHKDLDPHYVWTLTRRPFKSHPIIPSIPPVENDPSGTSKSIQVAPNPSLWSPWHLWDGRYWIRLLNRSAKSLTVRPLCKPDLQALRPTLSESHRKLLGDTLRSASPGKVRWTLPAIAEVVQGHAEPGRLLALPTLGKAGMLTLGDEDGGEQEVEWEVRYKCVDFGRGREEGGPGSRRDFIKTWL